MEYIGRALDWLTSVGGYADRHATCFIRYATAGTAAFAIDFSLLWLFTDTLGVYYLVSAVIAFLFATSINYQVIRRWAFPESTRTLTRGFMYYVGIAAMGVVLTVLLLAFFVEVLALHYLLARALIALFVGIWTFFINARFNFRTM